MYEGQNHPVVAFKYMYCIICCLNSFSIDDLGNWCLIGWPYFEINLGYQLIFRIPEVVFNKMLL